MKILDLPTIKVYTVLLEITMDMKEPNRSELEPDSSYRYFKAWLNRSAGGCIH